MNAQCTVCLEPVELVGEAPLTRFKTHSDPMWNETCSGSGDPHWTTPSKPAAAAQGFGNWVASLNPLSVALLIVAIAVVAGLLLVWLVP